MFTYCPACTRQFRVRASQLAQAEGLVQCGFCGKQFNALERLYDKPVVIDSEPAAVVTEADSLDADFYIPEIEADSRHIDNPGAAYVEPVGDITIELPTTEANDPLVSESVTIEEETRIVDEAITATTEPVGDITIELPETEANDPLVSESATFEEDSRITEEAIASTDEPAIAMAIDRPDAEANDPPLSKPSPIEKSNAADYPFPTELVEAEAPTAGRVSRLLWTVGVLVLLLAGAAQAAWFYRDVLLIHYPQFLPQAKQVCAYFDCTLVRNRNISAIKLLNRDVRVHPRYENALLVNATMTNLSKYAQRFPLVILSLYDTTGKVIAYRQIHASDYLDSSIDVEAGMPPDSPIHFVLEVADADTDAVSFEFDFL